MAPLGVQVLASAVRTATTTSIIYSATSDFGVLLAFNVTAHGGGNLSVEMELEDLGQGAGTFMALVGFDPVTGTGQKLYAIRFGDPVAAGNIDSVFARNIPQGLYRFKVTHSTGDSQTYSLGLSFYNR